MKKIIAIAVCLLMTLSLFAGCSDTPANETTETGSKLAKAKEFLETMYKPDGKDTVVELYQDKDVLASVTVDGVSYKVTWTVTITKGSSDAVVIGESEKENQVTIDIPDLPEEDIEFTATATVTDKDGKKEVANFKYKVTGIVIGGMTDAETVEAAYELAAGESLEDEATITGKVVSIETPWNETDKTIGVKIQVGDLADKLLLCPGFAVESADAIKVGDTITVVGYITNNNGSVEFKAGATLDEVISEGQGGTTDPEEPDTDESTTGTTATTTPSSGTTTKPTSGTGNKPTSGTTTKPTSGIKLPSTMTGIVDAAYALAEGAELPTATLTGKVIAVDEAYSDEFKNITVTISVTGREDKPIKCYRLKGDGVEKIIKGDTITVTGILKKRSNNVQFDLGCTLDKRVAGQTSIKQETDPEKIMAAALKLAVGEDMGYDVTLRGEVVGMDTAYNPDFDNVSVVIKVAGTNLLCYRLTGKDADKIMVGDTITVTGRIKNYNGKIQFGQGCTMRKREAGEAQQLTTVADIMEAAFKLEPGSTLPHDVTLTGKITEINTPYAAAYKNITVTIVVDGYDDKPLKCYRMKAKSGDTAETEALKVGDVITVTGIIKNYQHSSGDCEVEFNTGCLFVKK